MITQNHSIKTAILIGCMSFLLFTGCKAINSGGTGTTGGGTSGTSSDPTYVGHWLSSCVDLGPGGLVSRIYMEIESNGKVSLAFLTYAGTNCTGAHTLGNEAGDPITEAEHTQNISEETVTGIPENFFVLKITTIADSSVQYVILFANDSEFYELTGFSTPHTTWTQWQGEADVFQFAANPTTYSPLSHNKYHFTASELP